MYLQVLNLLVSLLIENKIFFWPFCHDLICQESDLKWKEKEGEDTQQRDKGLIQTQGRCCQDPLYSTT